jgi:ribosome modulation factor
VSAYDKGFAAGLEGRQAATCPYKSQRNARVQWFDGFDKGCLEREAAKQIPVNLPFERIPQHASDPGFGPVPPESNVVSILSVEAEVPQSDVEADVPRL